jgi:hypothetical protein
MTVHNWECPYCGTFTTVNDDSCTHSSAALNTRSKHGSIGLSRYVDFLSQSILRRDGNRT